MSVTLVQKWQLVQAAAKDPDLSKAAVIVLLRLLEYHNTSDPTREHRCFPKITTLAADLGFKPRHVSDLVKELVYKNWITSEKQFDPVTKRQISNSYTFLSGPPRTTVHSCPAPQCMAGDALQDMPPMHHSAYKLMNTNQGRNIGRSAPVIDKPADQERTAEHALGLPTIPANDASRKAAGKSKALSPDEIEAQFAELKAAYPKRPSPKWSPARTKFVAAIKRGVLPAIIIDGARGYGAACARDGTAPQFIQQPLTWFNQEGWTVDHGPVAQSSAPAPAAALNPRQWAEYVREFRGGGAWPAFLGPMPGSAGCRVPPEVQRENPSYRKAAS